MSDGQREGSIMKKELWKLILCILTGALLCHVKMFDGFPFVAVWFVAVYMEEYYRRAFVSFMFLWMFLWLPILSLSRYGISLLAWMVIVAILERMHVYPKRILLTILAGAITVCVSLGGTVLTTSTPQDTVLFLLEGLFIAGLSFFANRPLGMLLAWQPKGTRTYTETALPKQAQEYKNAMSYLAQSIGTLVRPMKEEAYKSTALMERQLQHRICIPCKKCDVCYGETGTMTLAVDELFSYVEKKESISEELQRRIYTQCERAEVLIREATSIFEKMELNESWYKRLCENREMIAGQIDAMAHVMGDCMEEEMLCDEREKWKIVQLKYHLRDMGLRVSNLHLYRKKSGAMRITTELATKWKSCITMHEIVECINGVTDMEMISADENRTIVGKEMSGYTFLTKPKVECSYGVAKTVQSGQEISGDSFRAERYGGEKFVMALSDGMGSGRQANAESETVVDLLLQFAKAGFTMDVTLRLMNAAMLLGADGERYATLDACIVDEYTGIVDFYKVGAHVSFIRRKKHVEIIDAESLPMGAAAPMDTVPNRSYLEAGDYLVMVTDGVLEYLHVPNPVEAMRDMIGELADSDAAAFSRKLMERIMLFTGGCVQDDMTILTLKTKER